MAETATNSNEAVIRAHWDKCEIGYYDENRKFIDNEGWLRTPFFKANKKGSKLLELKKGTSSVYRPKSLNGII